MLMTIKHQLLLPEDIIFSIIRDFLLPPDYRAVHHLWHYSASLQDSAIEYCRISRGLRQRDIIKSDSRYHWNRFIHDKYSTITHCHSGPLIDRILDVCCIDPNRAPRMLPCAVYKHDKKTATLSLLYMGADMFYIVTSTN
jgi:hypothetical protein